MPPAIEKLSGKEPYFHFSDEYMCGESAFSIIVDNLALRFEEKRWMTSSLKTEHRQFQIDFLKLPED
jgi:hypothetical protein